MSRYTVLHGHGALVGSSKPSNVQVRRFEWHTGCKGTYYTLSANWGYSNSLVAQGNGDQGYVRACEECSR